MTEATKTRGAVGQQAQWKAPGPGSWVQDRSHGPSNPTPLFRRIVVEHTAPIYAEVMEDLGGGIKTIDMAFVNGSMYRRLVPLVGAKFDRGTVPPNPILWLVTRAHPAFRRRERTAAEYFSGDRFEREIEKWKSERPPLMDKNVQLSAIDPDSLDAEALAKHLGVLDDHLVAGWKRHHYLHGTDLGPIGDLLVHTNEWGMDPVEVMGLLQGASLATADAARHGLAMAEALKASDVDPQSVDSVEQIRAVPSANASLDRFLDEFGWRMVTSYDLEGRTLHELPSTICSLVRSAGTTLASGDAGESEEDNIGIHETMPLSQTQEQQAQSMAQSCDNPELFRQLLARARRAYGLRDDNGPLTWEWPIGLMRRAFLAAGKHLQKNGELTKSEHVFEMDVPELTAMLRGDRVLTDSELLDRASHRRWEADQDGPDFLGPPPPSSPDLSALPPALSRVMAVVVAATTMLEPDQDRERVDLAGLGIGNRTYQGLARVADNADEAIQAMMPGEVLVAAWTAPSFNAVLSIAGAAVVQEGGLLCHAAVMARELDIPTIVGCTNAMSLIETGDVIEVDPDAGTVRIVTKAAEA